MNKKKIISIVMDLYTRLYLDSEYDEANAHTLAEIIKDIAALI